MRVGARLVAIAVLLLGASVTAIAPRSLANRYAIVAAPSVLIGRLRMEEGEGGGIRAAALDARAEMIEVEAGSAAAPLRRVRD